MWRMFYALRGLGGHHCTHGGMCWNSEKLLTLIGWFLIGGLEWRLLKGILVFSNVAVVVFSWECGSGWSWFSPPRLQGSVLPGMPCITLKCPSVLSLCHRHPRIMASPVWNPIKGPCAAASRAHYSGSKTKVNQWSVCLRCTWLSGCTALYFTMSIM